MVNEVEPHYQHYHNNNCKSRDSNICCVVVVWLPCGVPQGTALMMPILTAPEYCERIHYPISTVAVQRLRALSNIGRRGTPDQVCRLCAHNINTYILINKSCQFIMS
ncbi:hypothetical protein J6590_089351 [Homalodisca vitripennis]|nr:hypothetical protein J6590_089351 [Homalodisca vitripennis]